MATLQQLQGAFVKADAAGEEKDAQTFADSIRSHPTFQQNAKESLDRGDYKYAEDGFSELGKDEQRANMSKSVARSMGLRDSEVDVTQGMGTYGRFKLSFQPTEQDKVKHLEDTYGRENIRAVDIGGKMKLLYRDEQETGNQFRAVDEEGVSLADFFGDTAGTALPIAGAIGAAVATGGTSILATAGAAALGGFAASAGQDVAVRAGSGEDIRLGEIAKRRGIETAIGIPIDLFTGVGGRIISKTVGKRAVEKSAGQLTAQVDDLLSKFNPEANIKLTAAQETSTDASLAQSVRAGIDEGGLESRALAKQRDEIGKISRILRGEEISDEPIEDVMQNVAERQFALVDAYEQRALKMNKAKIDAEALAKKQTKAQKRRVTETKQAELDAELKAMRDQAQTGIKKLTKGKQRLESVHGSEIRSQQEQGLKNTDTESTRLYDDFYSKVDTQQAHTPVSKIQGVLDSIDDATLIPDSPELRGLQSLRRRVEEGGDLNFRDLDSFIRDVTDGIRYNKSHGFKQSELNLQRIGKKLDKLRDDAMSAPKRLGGLGAGTEAKKAYKKAQAHYKNKMLPFFDGDRKANLARVAGGSAEAATGRGESVLARTFGTGAAVKDAIDSGVQRSTLKSAYIEQAVRASDGGQIKVDDNILAALYSNGDKGAKVRADISRINKALRDGGKGTKVSSAEVNAIIDEFDAPAKAKAIRALAEKKASEVKAKAARNSALIKISKGELPTPDDIHHFVGDIAKMRPSQIAKLMDRLPSDRARASLRRSGYDSLMEKAGAKSSKAQRTGKATDRELLWEPDTMHSILNNSAERKQWEALLGKEQVADLAALNNWLLSSSAITKDMAEGIGRFVTSTGASGTPNILFVSPQLPRWIGRKVLGVVHTSPLTRGMMRRHLKEGTMDEDAVMNLFYTAMATRRGMDAITDEMAKDPAFSAYVQESMKDNEAQ
jgi:hypothetical protein